MPGASGRTNVYCFFQLRKLCNLWCNPSFTLEALKKKQDEEAPESGVATEAACDSPSRTKALAVHLLHTAVHFLGKPATVPRGPRWRRHLHACMTASGHVPVVCALLVLSLLTTLLLYLGGAPAPDCSGPLLHTTSKLHDLPAYHGPPASHPDRYTLLLNSFRRPALLRQSIQHYVQCGDLDAIRVIWGDGSPPPNTTSAADLFAHPLKEVRFDVVSNASLNMRFWPLEGLRTVAVLNIDDDILAPCIEVTRAFKAWQARPRALVGFYPRLALQRADCSWRYLMGFGTLMWHARYNIVLTKAAFHHRDWLEAYTHHMPAGIRAHVDAAHNCEDLAMQLLVSNATREPPFFVHSLSTVDLGKGLSKVQGISSQSMHGSARSNCLDVFATFYGGSLPLHTRRLSDHAHSAWLRLAPLTETLYSLWQGRL